MNHSDSNNSRWCCPNRDCDWSMVAAITEAEEGAPRCVCGSLMERVETVPEITYLDFLRGDVEMGEEPETEESN